MPGRAELRAMIALWLLVGLVFAVPAAYERWMVKEVTYDYSRFEREIEAFERSAIVIRERHERAGPVKRVVVAKAFRFDPNTTDSLGWLSLGVPVYTARSILKFVRKGGRFHTPEDLKRIYTLKPETFARLEPYVTIREADRNTDNTRPRLRRDAVAARRVPVDLNTADSLTLDSLPGIGPAFASRIMRYRERLGGFCNPQQLLEVYGVDSILFERLKDRVVVGTEVRKLNINTVTFDELRKHPYLTYKQVNAILQYRKQHGNFASIDDLLKTGVVTNELLLRIRPYLAL